MFGKTLFCGGMDSKMEIRGFPMTQMDCMVPRRCLGEVVPPNPTKNMFLVGLASWGKFWGGRPALVRISMTLYITHWHFVGPMVRISSVWGPAGLAFVRAAASPGKA